jgi:hypothetical protein
MYLLDKNENSCIPIINVKRKKRCHTKYIDKSHEIWKDHEKIDWLLFNVLSEQYFKYIYEENKTVQTIYNVNKKMWHCELRTYRSLEEFEDTKGVIRIRISKKNRQHNGKQKSTKGQTAINKTYI